MGSSMIMNSGKLSTSDVRNDLSHLRLAALWLYAADRSSSGCASVAVYPMPSTVCRIMRGPTVLESYRTVPRHVVKATSAECTPGSRCRVVYA